MMKDLAAVWVLAGSGFEPCQAMGVPSVEMSVAVFDFRKVEIS
jgi:hypothetical protein